MSVRRFGALAAVSALAILAVVGVGAQNSDELKRIEATLRTRTPREPLNPKLI